MCRLHGAQKMHAIAFVRVYGYIHFDIYLYIYFEL